MHDVHLVPELQSQVQALALSLQDKTQEAEALHDIVQQYKSEVAPLDYPGTCTHTNSVGCVELLHP